MRAYRTVSRLSHREGSPWNDPRRLFEDLRNRMEDLASRIHGGGDPSGRDFAQLLLSLVNLARLQGYRAEDCLHDLLRDLDA